MQQAVRREARYEDLYGAPDHLVGEIIDGEVLMSPRPRSRHAHVAFAVGGDLRQAFQRGGETGPGGWWLLPEPELHLGAFTGRARPRDEVLVPDLAGWRRERMPRMPDLAAFELPPDWVCEVLSPSTARIDRIRKMPVYAQAGVAFVWLVDPLVRTVEVFRLLDQGLYGLVRTVGGEEPTHAEPFEAVELDLAGWWLEDEAPTPEANDEPSEG